MKISSLKAAVIGDPIKHSLSPLLHGFWLKRYQIEGAFERVQVPIEGFEDHIRKIVSSGYQGFNITLPHKQRIIPLCTIMDDGADKIGAVNMVTIHKDGRLEGFNTDIYGFVENLKDCAGFLQLPLRKKAVIIGAGGAAFAVLAGIISLQFESIMIINRSSANAEKLVHHFKHHYGDDLKAKLETSQWDLRHEALAGADLLVNCSSLGMQGMEPLPLDLAHLPNHCVVNDIVYRPLMTELLKDAQRRGNPIQDGLGMLLHQAAPAFKAWFLTPDHPLPSVDQNLRDHLLSNFH